MSAPDMGVTVVEGCVPFGYIIDENGQRIETWLLIEFGEHLWGICIAPPRPTWAAGSQ